MYDKESTNIFYFWDTYNIPEKEPKDLFCIQRISPIFYLKIIILFLEQRL